MRDEASRWITTSEAAQRLGVKRATSTPMSAAACSTANAGRGSRRASSTAPRSMQWPRRPAPPAQPSRSCVSGASPPRSAVSSTATCCCAECPSPTSSTGCPSTRRPRSCSVRHLFPAGTCATWGPSSAASCQPCRSSGACLSPCSSSPRRILAVDTDPAEPDSSSSPPSGRRWRPSTRPRPGSIRAQVPSLLVAALLRAPASRADGELMGPLTTLLDHGLTASTIAARVAASTRAGIHDCLCAGFAVMSGPRTARPPWRHERCSTIPGVAPKPSRRRCSHGGVPGFGHFLYPDGDPRAELVLATLWRRRGYSSAASPRRGAVRRRRRPLGSAAQHRPRERGSRARAGPAGRRRRSRLPGRPLPWAHRARARGVRRDAAPVARQGGHRLSRQPSTRVPLAGAPSRPSGIRHDPESVRAPGRRRGGAPTRASRWRQRRRR